MKTKLLALLALSLSTVACTGAMHMASVNEAYKKYEKQDYAATLKLIAQAESTGEATGEQEAQLTYLKALAYEGLGEQALARGLFDYIVEVHPSSQYAYLAVARRNDSD